MRQIISVHNRYLFCFLCGLLAHLTVFIWKAWLNVHTKCTGRRLLAQRPSTVLPLGGARCLNREASGTQVTLWSLWRLTCYLLLYSQLGFLLNFHFEITWVHGQLDEGSWTPPGVTSCSAPIQHHTRDADTDTVPTEILHTAFYRHTPSALPYTPLNPWKPLTCPPLLPWATSGMFYKGNHTL